MHSQNRCVPHGNERRLPQELKLPVTMSSTMMFSRRCVGPGAVVQVVRVALSERKGLGLIPTTQSLFTPLAQVLCPQARDIDFDLQRELATRSATVSRFAAEPKIDIARYHMIGPSISLMNFSAVTIFLARVVTRQPLPVWPLTLTLSQPGFFCAPKTRGGGGAHCAP